LTDTTMKLTGRSASMHCLVSRGRGCASISSWSFSRTDRATSRTSEPRRHGLSGVGLVCTRKRVFLRAQCPRRLAWSTWCHEGAASARHCALAELQKASPTARPRLPGGQGAVLAAGTDDRAHGVSPGGYEPSPFDPSCRDSPHTRPSSTSPEGRITIATSWRTPCPGQEVHPLVPPELPSTATTAPVEFRLRRHA